MRVLTLATVISYSFLTASFTWLLLALLSTINTKVLLSSIFFIADSVVRGYLTILNWSNLYNRNEWENKIHFYNFNHKTHSGLFEWLFLGYLGFLARQRVFGLLKWTLVLIFRLLLSWTPLATALLAFKAFVLGSLDLTGLGAAGLVLGATLGLAGALALGFAGSSVKTK